MSIWSCSLVAINKMKNITSAKLVDKIKAVIHDGCKESVRMGHGGTLDETATGVLVIGTGLGCKLLPQFLHGSKTYTVQACLGTETNTYNECGEIIRQLPYHHVTEEMVSATLKLFQGKILQKPPAYSALKVKGRRVADWTRDGVFVDIPQRMVHCYSIRMIKLNKPLLELEVNCGGGFYVRSLVHDLGKALGTCAYVTSLHRKRHGFLSDRDALSSEDWSYDQLVRNAQRIARRGKFKQVVARLQERQFSDELWTDET